MITAILWISSALLVLLSIALVYWYRLAIGSARKVSSHPGQHSSMSTSPQTGEKIRFGIAIPAHDEEAVIGATVQQLQRLDYPASFRIYLAADHCSDRTAVVAREAGALVFERSTGPAGSKGAALSWLFERIFEVDPECDAVVVFDADTRVDKDFLSRMADRLRAGERVIQGNHIISNPQEGWFPALTWAMFLVDNRFQNQGRANLGISAKNMGDAICFKADVLHQYGWGEGLTEDYAFRQRLLLEGIRIGYEPRAKAYGQAPWSWQIAQRQRLRWLQGVREASRGYRGQLLRLGWQTRNLAMLEGALQGFIPSYSTLTLVTALLWAVHLSLYTQLPAILTGLWSLVLGLLFIYPLIGLALEKAPFRAYAAILTGPFFILWRTGLKMKLVLHRRPVTWVRTPHRGGS